ncbi:hypothetical protein QIL36_gp1 [ssRNA phage SRR6960803_6]|uniref:Uncharacterized protein n=1 Tax=ssRNA phage SRR6960803_6 TaxID=2786622 RepID=A0A8S5KY61_9VIRU|nr:hypothetical protein QIL36_gp1 [ssRNA phage SRR6960803_6]DAD50718.1 TPA_asm: hypothetical protein [ssRNA phage SRR6960803_6]
MSIESQVRIYSVRLLSVTQASFLSSVIDEGDDGRLGNQFLYEPMTYDFIEIVSSGWTGGAKLRVKRISKEKALAYANKLLSGAWIDEIEYHKLYVAIDHLLNGMCDLRSAWEARYSPMS